MKLELKHLAPYLPYELKIRNVGVGSTRTLIHELPTESAIRRNVSIKMLLLTSHINKLILRPLSDLDKKYLDHMYFIIISTDNDIFGSRDEFEDYFNETDCEYLPQCLFEYLLECHFDLFGLIEKGLAIDINKTK